MSAINTPFGALRTSSDPSIRRIPTDVVATDAQPVIVEVSGNFVALISSPGGSNPAIRFNDTHGDSLPLQDGDSVDGLIFIRLYLTFTAVAGGVIILFISQDDAIFKPA
jgi:hypothetical protein